MYTSCFALGLILAPMMMAAETPAWQQSYAEAAAIGQKQGRPVVVFVATGPQAQATFVKEGQISKESLKVLAQKYVCLYLDRSQVGNQRLIRDLGITQTGLVISDRTGDYQAFHHDGSLSQADLAQQLARFADPKLVVTTTVSNTSQRTSFYNGGGVQPASYSSRTVNC